MHHLPDSRSPAILGPDDLVPRASGRGHGPRDAAGGVAQLLESIVLVDHARSTAARWNLTLTRGAEPSVGLSPTTLSRYYVANPPIGLVPMRAGPRSSLVRPPPRVDRAALRMHADDVTHVRRTEA